MNSIKPIIILLVLNCLVFCKRTNLKQRHSNLIGTWYWVSGWVDDSDSTFRLVIEEKGKYKLYSNNKQLERGRLIVESGYLKFKSDNIPNRTYLSNRSIKDTNNRKLEISKIFLTDQPISIYNKK